MTTRLFAIIFCCGLLAGILPYPAWTVIPAGSRAAGSGAAPCCCQPGKCRMPACPSTSSGRSGSQRAPASGCALSACHPTVIALDSGKGLFTFTLPRGAAPLPVPLVRPSARAHRTVPASFRPSPLARPPRVA